MKVGILALQGDVSSHRSMLNSLDVDSYDVKVPDDLARIDSLIIPGGESTTMVKLAKSSGLFDELKQRIASGLPVFGTCAGLILLATEIHHARADQVGFGALDVTVDRNAYGAQSASFETSVWLNDDPHPFPGIFIRAPRIERVSKRVEVLGELNDEAVLIRQGSVLASTFHPEQTTDPRVHQMFLRTV